MQLSTSQMLEKGLTINCACEFTNQIHYFHLEHYFSTSSCSNLLLATRSEHIEKLIISEEYLAHFPASKIAPMCI